ncbi:MAG TPA: transporter [Candidatus Udaeobacter sp.]
MRTRTHLLSLCTTITLAFKVLFPSSAFAVEGGMQRPISGMQIAPFAAVIPPEPGFAVSVSEIYYSGSIGGAANVAIAGLLVANVDVKASFTPITLLYIWPTPTKAWNFASAIGFPLAWVEGQASVSLGPFAVRKKDTIFGLYDLVFTPLVASHHFSETDHLAFNFTFWAPTGSYETGKLANLSLNNWSFIPGIAYTKIVPQPNIELTGIWNMYFYTENPATHYQSGIQSDLEVLAIKRFKNGFGIGFVESWIQQITDDKGALADRLDGFVGRSFGIGPIITYSTKLGKSHLDFNARWIHDFDVRNAVEGDGFNFTASLKF